jgi:hypothetical protein
MLRVYKINLPKKKKMNKYYSPKIKIQVIKWECWSTQLDEPDFFYGQYCMNDNLTHIQWIFNRYPQKIFKMNRVKICILDTGTIIGN